MMRLLQAYTLCLIASFCVMGVNGVFAADQLTVGEAMAVSPKADAFQRVPDIAYGAGRFLVVWQDGWNGEGGDSNILGALLDAEGKLLSATPIKICSAKGVQETPSVGYLGGKFVAVWADLRNDSDYDIYFTWITVEGKVARTEQLLVKDPQNQVLPRIASSGDVALMVWQDVRDAKYYRIYGSRLTADGRILDTDGLQLSKEPGSTPAVAASQEGFLVVWTHEHLALKYLRAIRGVRVGLDGAIQGEIPPHGFHGEAILPSVTSSGEDFLFIGTRKSSPNYWGWGGPSAFYAARILADGSAPDKDLVRQYQYKLWPNILDGAWLHKDIWLHKYSDVTWNGKEYVAIWTRAHIQNQVMLTNFDLYATRIRFPNWQKLDSPTGPIPDKAWEMDNPPAPGIPVADTPNTEASPALCGGPGGKVLAAYELHKPEGAIEVVTKMLSAP